MGTIIEPMADAGAAPPPISKAAPALLRTLFLHHDGIVVGATVAALGEAGVLAALWRERQLTLSDLVQAFPCKEGYLRVALRCLALQGWIDCSGPPRGAGLRLQVTALGLDTAEAFPLYREIARYAYSGASMESRLWGPIEAAEREEFARLTARCIQGFGLPRNGRSLAAPFEIVAKHLEGMLIGPLMIAAKMRGLLAGDRFAHGDVADRGSNLPAALELLRYLGWVVAGGDRYTATGRAACEYALHYGLTLSYLPLFCKLPELIFHPGHNITHVQPGREETHVDRTLNVLASGVAHRPYFEDSDRLILELFDREPLSEQPHFVADMGCGDGAWLERIYKTVAAHSLRGRNLRTHPLLMIGADYNQRALEVTRRRLEAAAVPHLLLFGDVTDPAGFAAALRERGIEIAEGLHIRAFIDHNRRYNAPENGAAAERRAARSSGAYADPNGRAIPNAALEQDLVEHLRRWVPYVERHGLVIIEAHNVHPAIASRYNGMTHATAFDTYHGYSNQYPVDFEAFMSLAGEAGLRPLMHRQRVYPSRLPFVAISINHFKALNAGLPCVPHHRRAAPLSRGPASWRPDGTEDLEDGEALHRFLYEGGDLRCPAHWCFHSTSLLIRELLAAIDERLNASGRVLTVVDYGAGTGLASLELLKAMGEGGWWRRIEQAGKDLKLVLVDFPSGWFAKAHELLRDHPFIEFLPIPDPHSGRPRSLADLLPAASVDIIYASMVLHLVPPKAIPEVLAGFARVLKPGGRLFWNAPDTAPAPSDATLIHAPNRALRIAILQLLEHPEGLTELLSRLPAEERNRYLDLRERLDAARRRLTAERRAEAQRRADKQILPVPNDARAIHALLQERFAGELSTSVSLLTEEDSLALALLPANQRYFGEIEDPDCRHALITLLLKHEVLPRLRSMPAGNPRGLNLHWSMGSYVKLR